MAGITFDGIPSTQTDSSTFSGTNFQGTTFSGATFIGSFTGRAGDSDGAIFSSIYGATTPGSAGTYGARVQAGRVGPLINTTGSIIFPLAFTNRNYVVSLAAEGPVADGLGSTVPYISSGITHATSGCTINAGSGYVYNWVAIGL